MSDKVTLKVPCPHCEELIAHEMSPESAWITANALLAAADAFPVLDAVQPEGRLN